MPTLNQMVVEYIATVQPMIEKQAATTDDFTKSLNSKLDHLVKSGSLTKDEATKIYKAACANPSLIFNYLEVPSYQHRIGQPLNKTANVATDGKPLDALAKFALGL
jgi:hypothetical protein